MIRLFHQVASCLEYLACQLGRMCGLIIVLWRANKQRVMGYESAADDSNIARAHSMPMDTPEGGPLVLPQVAYAGHV